MTSADLPDTLSDRPALYEIRVRGVISDNWSDLLEDMTLQMAYDGVQPVTVLRAVVRDQAALAGLLDALFGLNVTVLSVAVVDAT